MPKQNQGDIQLMHFKRTQRHRSRALGRIFALFAGLGFALSASAQVSRRGQEQAPPRAPQPGAATPRSASEADISRFTANIPARFSRLDPQLVRLLAASVLDRSLIQPESQSFRGQSLWQFIDDRMNSAHIQTLVQAFEGARALGLVSHVRRLRAIYYGSSWGIEFYGDTATLTRFVRNHEYCRDPALVRRWHGNSLHDWYRNLRTEAGNPGLHLGIDAGAGHHNLHIDSTNPASGHAPFGINRCWYGVYSVIAHNVDISDGAPGFPAPFAARESERYLARRIHLSLENRRRYRMQSQVARSMLPDLLNRMREVVQRMDREDPLLRVAAASFLAQPVPGVNTGSVPVTTLAPDLGTSYAPAILAATQGLASMLRQEGIALGIFPSPDAVDGGSLQQDAAIDEDSGGEMGLIGARNLPLELRRRIGGLEVIELRSLEALPVGGLSSEAVDRLYEISGIFDEIVRLAPPH